MYFKHLYSFNEDSGKSGNELTKREHIIIIGGSGKCFYTNFHYCIEKDISSIAESSNDMSVGFVKLFWRRDKLWINKKVKSVNFKLDGLCWFAVSTKFVFLKL
jgi:hypothetical protein